jgi:Stringent starvation protein B
MRAQSTKPYLVRAIYEWCNDCGYTPQLVVQVGGAVKVPLQFVQDGQIVLNISPMATNRLQIGNDAVTFQARFGGKAQEIYVPIDFILAIFARENGEGMAFEVSEGAELSEVSGMPDAAAPAGLEDATPAALPSPPALAAVTTSAVAPEGAKVQPFPVRNAAPGPDDLPPEPPSGPAGPAGPSGPGDRPRLTRVK